MFVFKNFVCSPKCVKRFLATVSSFWSWAFKLSSSSKARLAWRTPTVTLQDIQISFITISIFFEITVWNRLMFYESVIIDEVFGLAKVQQDWIRFSCGEKSFNFLQICVQLFPCMHICTFLLISYFWKDFVLWSWDSAWSIESIDNPSFVDKQSDFQIFSSPQTQKSLSLPWTQQDITYWKHSLTMATSLESNCLELALLTRHTSSKASLSS